MEGICRRMVERRHEGIGDRGKDALGYCIRLLQYPRLFLPLTTRDMTMTTNNGNGDVKHGSLAGIVAILKRINKLERELNPPDDSFPTLDDCTLVDDGTMDTVVSVRGVEYRYSAEFAAEYRDDSGMLDFDEFCKDVVLFDASF